MSLATIITAIVVTLVISSIAAIAGYYLQTRLRRLEELEEARFAPVLEMPVPTTPPVSPATEAALETALRDDAWERIREIGAADLLVGIPSYKNAETIGHVVKTAAEGMVKYFPDMKPVLVNSDGGSPDRTREAVLSTPVPEGVEVISIQYQGLSGKGSAFRAIFEIAKALGVKACIVVDSDLRSIEPWWIERLAGPILKGDYDYVTPYYIRHKYDGTITNTVCYPMTCMLYGVDVRQPIGGDFGFSAKLAESYLAKDVWNTDVARFGVDIWMTTTAINEGARICQARLGAKVHDARDPAATLGPMFKQVVGTLFRLMGLYEDNWRKVKESQQVPFYGEPVEAEPEPVQVTLRAMIDAMRAGAQKLGPLWQEILDRENFSLVNRIASQGYDEYDFPAEVWAKVVFDFAVAYNKSDITPADVIEAMTPLYFGRVAGLVIETLEKTNVQAEEVILAQAMTFRELKSYLIDRWERS